MLYVQQVHRFLSSYFRTTGWIEETSFNGRKRFLRSLIHFGYDTGDPDMTLMAWKHWLYWLGGMDKSVQHNKQVIKKDKKKFSYKQRETKMKSEYRITWYGKVMVRLVLKQTEYKPLRAPEFFIIRIFSKGYNIKSMRISISSQAPRIRASRGISATTGTVSRNAKYAAHIA